MSSWGTLKTNNFPNTLQLEENCWCKLSSTNGQRIVLSVISFNLNLKPPQNKLIAEQPNEYDSSELNAEKNECTEAGLFLQSDHKRSKDCTRLLKDHYYISSSQHLYLNYFSKKAVSQANSLTNGFWIIYEGFYNFNFNFKIAFFSFCICFFEASDGESNIHLKCGDTGEARPEEIEIHLNSTTTTTTTIKPLIASEIKEPFKITVGKQFLLSSRKPDSNLTSTSTSAAPVPSTKKAATIIETITTTKKSSRLSTNGSKRSKPVSMKQFISTLKPTVLAHKQTLNNSLQNNVKLMTLKSILTVSPTSIILTDTFSSIFSTNTTTATMPLISTKSYTNITAITTTPSTTPSTTASTRLPMINSTLNTTFKKFKSSNKLNSTSHKKLITFGNETNAGNRKNASFYSQSTLIDQTKLSK